MDRRTGTRLTIAAGLTVGLSFAIAPQWVSGSTDAGDTTLGATAEPTPIAAIDDQVWPVDLHAAAPIASSAVDNADADDVPVVEVAPEPAAVPAPAPQTAPAPAPTPAPEADVKTTGTVHVDVTAVDGATRTVSLKTTDGSLVGGPVTVDGSRISFSDVADGTYDVFAEQAADGGGIFLTRTTIVVSGSEVVVHCDDETLDCTVS